MQDITLKVRNLPVYHSDYLRGSIEYAKLNKKEKEKFQEMLSLLCNLVNTDVPFEFVEFYINQERFFPSFIRKKEYPLVLKDIRNKDIRLIATSDLLQISSINYTIKEEQLSDQLSNTPSYKYSQTIKEEKLKRIQLVAKKAFESKHPCFFYHQIPVQEQELFSYVNGCKVLNTDYLPYLPFLDLSSIDFSHSNLIGLDLSNTNIRKIDFSSLYQGSIQNTDFSNVNLFGKELTNIDARGANLCGTWLQVNVDTVLLEDTKLDDSLLFIDCNDQVISADKHGFVLQKKKQNSISLRF